MPTINKFEELEIWQLDRELSKKIFEETKKRKLIKYLNENPIKGQKFKDRTI